MLSSLLKPVLPGIRADPIQNEKLAVVVESSLASMAMATAAAVNCQLLRRDAVLASLRLNDLTARRARSAPFLGSGLLGPDTKGFATHIAQLRQEEAVHAGRTAHFKAPAKLPPRPRGKVWSQLGEPNSVAPPSSVSHQAAGFDYARLGHQPFRGRGRGQGQPHGRGGRGGRGRGASSYDNLPAKSQSSRK